jgi:hypothetical protein
VHFSEYVATLLRTLLPLSWRLKSMWWRVSILERCWSLCEILSCLGRNLHQFSSYIRWVTRMLQ